VAMKLPEKGQELAPPTRLTQIGLAEESLP
jgi:hypothetical protein